MTHQRKLSSTSAHMNAKKGFRIHFLVFLLTTPLIWLVWYLTDRTYIWPLWSTLAWVVGILFHFLGVYFFKNFKNK
ncbi:2TM domain-containing protein [Chryseobacterium wanjuense]|uniref:2TM domain-containing protein n=2 Tax=Chryseobacterium wanjuense TaxID=356305 RepID=A0A1I0RP89_9FLAO|nr:2TM domain-containing protein [Chryseobacterium wanjuense]